MPVISEFFGITIRMYYQEHEPPHFHAEYRDGRSTFDFEGQPLSGEMRSRRARRLIRMWALRNQRELESNWSRINAGEPILPIPPLE